MCGCSVWKAWRTESVAKLSVIEVSEVHHCLGVIRKSSLFQPTSSLDLWTDVSGEGFRSHWREDRVLDLTSSFHLSGDRQYFGSIPAFNVAASEKYCLAQFGDSTRKKILASDGCIRILESTKNSRKSDLKNWPTPGPQICALIDAPELPTLAPSLSEMRHGHICLNLLALLALASKNLLDGVGSRKMRHRANLSYVVKLSNLLFAPLRNDRHDKLWLYLGLIDQSHIHCFYVDMTRSQMLQRTMCRLPAKFWCTEIVSR